MPLSKRKLLIFTAILVATITLFQINNKTKNHLQNFAAVLKNTTFESLAGNQTNTLLHNDSSLTKLRHNLNCDSHKMAFTMAQHGEYVILYNFIKAEKNYACHESITFSAPADFTFLDNLSTLVDRWKGPISVALYAPGDDFAMTLRSIAFARLCLGNSQYTRDLVTFHVFYHQEHLPKNKSLMTIYDRTYKDSTAICNHPAPYLNIQPKDTYRRKHNLLFPINVARNIARQTAQTHYVFAADIELYPSLEFIPKFMSMLIRLPELISGERPRIFALPIFEVKQNVTVPNNKTMLQKSLKSGDAQLFHKRICSPCHSIPNLTQWEREKETEDLDIFTVGKRVGKHAVWEAFYVGTKDDPLFDEQYSWEGQSNKMSQGYAMCLLDYDYMVLNNAFIIHKPGIKRGKEQIRSFGDEVRKSNTRLRKITKPMLNGLYGERKGCHL